MTYIRRLILALALSSCLAPAFAQVPPPVPALPDSERRTTYSISGTTCACAINMALYGDGTDYQNWIEVFINGIRANFNDASFGWTVTSPSGSLSGLARPITDAILTFNSVQTGTIQIVGARRPRRTSQFNEGAGVPTRNFNVVLSDLTAQNREVWDKINDVTGRSVRTPPGETLNLLPVLANRQNLGACFDSGGNLNSCVSVPASTFTAGNGVTLTGVGPTTITNNITSGSGVAITGTNPLTITADIAAGAGISFTGTHPISIAASASSNVRSAYTGTASMATTDCGKTVALGGSAFYTFTVNVASSYSATCQVLIVNEDSNCPSNGASTCRGKMLAINGYGNFILWPGQLFTLINQNAVWQFNRPGRWITSVNMTWYVNHVSGTTPSDCLQPNAGACATIAQAVLQAQQAHDCNPQVNPTIQLANETFTESNVIVFGAKPCYHEFFIVGNTSTPTNVVWTVPAGQVGLQTRDYGIATLNGIKFVSSGAGATAFSATQMGVIDFTNIEFGLFASGTHMSCVNNAGINFIPGTYVVSGNVANHITANGPCMIIIAGNTINLPNALTFTNWVQAQAVGVVNFGGNTFTGTGAGAGSTGTKYNVSLNAVLVLSGVVLPGATAGITGSGGQVQ